jgi:hypothetical protein
MLYMDDIVLVALTKFFRNETTQCRFSWLIFLPKLARESIQSMERNHVNL